MNSIYTYLDYREYLHHFYYEQKKLHSYYSYRYIAYKVDMNISSVVRVFNGKLHIHENKIDKICKLCKLSPKEREYFETLVQYAKVKNGAQKELYHNKLDELRDIDIKVISNEELDLKWYYAPIWTILSYQPFNYDYAALANILIPPISEQEAKDAISILLKYNLVKKNDIGHIVANYSFVQSSVPIKKEILYKKFTDAIYAAVQAMHHVNEQEKSLTTLSFSLPENKFPAIKKMADTFIQKLIKFTDENSGTKEDLRAYTCNLIIVPQSQKKN